MKKLIYNLKLTKRINIYVTLVIIGIFTLMTILIYDLQHKKDIAQGDERMSQGLKSIVNAVDSYCEQIKMQNKLDSLQTYCINSDVDTIKKTNVSIKHIRNESLMKQILNYNEKNSKKTYHSLFEEILNDEERYNGIKKIFSRKYYSTGYPFMIKKDGLILIHPNKEKENFSDKKFFKLIINSKEKMGHEEYIWPEDKTGKWEQEYFTYYAPLDAYIVCTVYNDDFDTSGSLLITLLICSLLSVFALTILIAFILKPVKNNLNNVSNIILDMSKGKINDADFDYKFNDEFSIIKNNLNGLVNGFKQYTNFSKRIGNNDLDSEFELLSKDDILGKSLLDMKQSLKKAQEDELIRKSEDDKRNWSTVGYAKFGEILRQNNDNMELLSFNIIKHLVDYMEMNQGGLFIINDNNKEHLHLELTACYAYNRHKFIHKSIEIGEGLVGACFQERQTIFLTTVPDNYIEITSGLGEANPKCILIVPLKLNDEIYGIIELASFKVLEKYQIEFVEKVGESIASTISSVKVNIRTAELLEVSQQQSEEMRAQEEEMRQNLEEMHATQEEMGRKNVEINGLLSAIDNATIKAEYSVEGQILSTNEKFRTTMGYSEHELFSKNVLMFIPINEQDKFKATWNQVVVNGQSVHSVVKRLNKAGQELWFDLTYTPIFDGNGKVQKVLYLSTDITNSKNMELSLKEKTEEMQAQEEELRQNLEKIHEQQEIMTKEHEIFRHAELETRKIYESEILNMNSLWLSHLENAEKIINNIKK